jgi:hypothetical protein
MVIRPISNRGVDHDSEIAKRRRSMCDQESEWQSMDGMQTLCLDSFYEEHAVPVSSEGGALVMVFFGIQA